MYTLPSFNSSRGRLLGDIPLKRSYFFFLAKKEQLITVMATMYSFVLDILKDPGKSFKSSCENG